MEFRAILNIKEKRNHRLMKELTDEDAGKLTGGDAAPKAACAAAIAFNASLGGLFGGAGAVLGAAVAATGPACLGWW
ncbi:hypothetical protein EOD41_14920 [Mucilaginibacter limnophilus]|uniref:Bacteriocin n=1 Tax=Mucilaginibacter limnophilus TaxID=1932778 RepID=A0A437MQ16_9SPHI|nr:hypothetical protein [Mucilaginibacter limnophilus]RVT99734.1 hypothetical protein EOD41_14920 [Mucilaginibacter limnophilus]